MKKHLTDLLDKKNTKWFYDDLYGINCYLVEMNDKQQLKILEKINKYFGDIKIQSSNGKMLNIEGDYLIIMKDKKDERTLTHELIHIVFDLFTSRGVLINLESDETFAYYYSYLYMNLKDS